MPCNFDRPAVGAQVRLRVQIGSRRPGTIAVVTRNQYRRGNDGSPLGYEFSVRIGENDFAYMGVRREEIEVI